MVSELGTEGEALRLFFTEDIYLVHEELVAVPDDNPQPVTAAPIVDKQPLEFKFLGNNKRNILILVNDDQNDVSDELGRKLLRKIVKSVNLTADDFALVNYARYRTASFKQLREYFDSNLVFAFGVSSQSLALPDYPENTLVEEGQVKIVFSSALPILNQDAHGKKALWGCLKNLNL